MKLDAFLNSGPGVKLMNEIANRYRSERIYRLDTILYTVYKNLSRKLSKVYDAFFALFLDFNPDKLERKNQNERFPKTLSNGIKPFAD
jgi:hypothetical protein